MRLARYHSILLWIVLELNIVVTVKAHLDGDVVGFVNIGETVRIGWDFDSGHE